jgi:hypothetical protein
LAGYVDREEFAKYYYNGQINEDKLERAETWSVYGILVRKLEGEEHFENLDVDGRMILRWSLEKEYSIDSSGSG